MLFLLPVISGFIGWITNYIAVKMIFHPRNPVTIMGITVQGLLPKRRLELARQVGEIVEVELLSNSEFTDIVAREGTAAFSVLIEEKIGLFLDTKLSRVNPMIASFISEEMKKKVKNLMMEEINKGMPEITAKVVEMTEQNLNVRDVVMKKIEAFDIARLEAIVLQIASKEFRYIEVLGGLLGFIIGLFQLFLLSQF